ncbi:MAG: ABC transporter substrate-binding protein [Planctomycetota bacterium]|nr:ABC transporter substrate-binding protein [Planctomycetota bacterium]
MRVLVNRSFGVSSEKEQTLNQIIRQIAKWARMAGWPSAGIALALILTTSFAGHAQELLIDLANRTPYDEITVKDQQGEVEALQLELLDIPGRQAPAIEKSGVMEIRLLGAPDDIYEVFWIDIIKIRLYEDIMLDELNGYIDARRFDDAFDYFLFLDQRYKGLPGVAEVLSRYQFVQGSQWLQDGRHLEALSLLEKVHLTNEGYVHDGGPDTAKTQLNAAAALVLNRYMEGGKTILARKLGQRLIRAHGASTVPAALDTLKKLNQLATEKRDEARRLLDAGELREAQRVVREMIDIYPPVPGGREIAVEAIRRYPLVTVGTVYPSIVNDRSRMDNWAARRTGFLTRRMFMEYEGPGPERGEYLSPYGEVRQGSDRKTLRIRISPEKIASGIQINGYHLSQRLLNLADEHHPMYNAQWAALFDRVEVRDVYDVIIHLRRPHVLPEALLQVFLDPSLDLDDPRANDGPFIKVDDEATSVRYTLNSKNPFTRTAPDPNFIPPSEILEMTYDVSGDAIKALKRGDIDVIDRVSPAQAVRLQNEAGGTIRVVPYALPTIHMLLPNYDKPYMRNELFRRAILYGIMREATLNELILKNHRIPGCQVVSGPFSPGIGLGDPLSYAYNRKVIARPYSPRLAVVLAKLAEQRMKEEAEQKEEEPPPIPELVIGYPAEEDARDACIAIEFQLEQLQIFKVKLIEFEPGQSTDETGECNLVYTKLAMWEPLVDTTRLLSPNGLVSIRDDHVNRTVQWLERSIRWQEVRDRVRQVHRIAHEKVAVIPLWQLREYFVHREGITLGADAPVALYHGIERWQLVPDFGEEE